MKEMDVESLDFEKGGGLLPIVVQDFETRDVLMVAYGNRESVQQTLKTGYAHYWSRSRRTLWKKGETSGHIQKVMEIRVDCDQDTLLYLVEQTGVACHTGEKTCFHNRLK